MPIETYVFDVVDKAGRSIRSGMLYKRLQKARELCTKANRRWRSQDQYRVIKLQVMHIEEMDE